MTTIVLPTLPESGTEALAALRTGLEAVKAELDRQQHLAEERRLQHEADILCIGDRLIQEADGRDWCDDYDDFVAALNETLHVALPRRRRDYIVRTTVDLDIDVSAVDEDDARSQAAAIVHRAEAELDRMDGVRSDPDYPENFSVEQC